MDRVINMENRPVESITLGFIEDAIKLTNSSFVREKIAYNFIKKGWIELEKGKFNLAYKYFNRALKIFNNRNDLMGYLLSKHGIASVYTKGHEYGKSLDIYFHILDHLDIKKSNLRFITLKDIAMTYYSWGSYENSIRYLNLAMKIIEPQKSVFRNIYIMYNLGKTYLKIGDNSKAQEALFMTLTINDTNKVNYKISESLTLLGNIFRKQNDFPRAESFHIRGLQYAKSNMDYRSHIDILLNLGSMCYYASEYLKALKYIETALEELVNIDNKYTILLKSYHYLYSIYKDLGEKDEALKYLQKLVVIKEDEKLRICKIQYELLHLHFKLTKKEDTFTIQKAVKRRIYFEQKVIHNNEMLDLGRAIYGNLKDVLSFDLLTIYTIKKGSSSLNQISIPSMNTIDSKIIDGKGTPALFVINNNKEIIVFNRDYADERNFNKSRLTKGMESFIILPILRSGRVVGAISIEDKNRDKYTQFDINTLKTMSAYISLSIENLRIKSEVDSLNALMENDNVMVESNDLNSSEPQHDNESNLPLKKLFIELLNQSIRGTKRQKGKLAILSIIVDLEFEKKGIFLSEDLVLGENEINGRIKGTLRAEDILGKSSEDTYLLTFKIESIRGCRAVAKKLIDQLNKPIFTENQKIQPRGKIGISIYPDNYITAEELIEQSTRCAQKISRDSTKGYEFSDSVHNITGID